MLQLLDPKQIPLSLYIHLPWCERKCPYCDFNSYKLTGNLPEKIYVERLLQDLQANLAQLAEREVISIFIGGGTPSLFSPSALDYLLTKIAQEIKFKKNIEITLEANPSSIEAEKFKDFRALGINRLSIGIQSFAAEKLKILGRVHDDRQAHRAVTIAQQAGFENFNLDLMHGLPGQTPAEAVADLRAAIAYQPPHLSWYELTIEPNTWFGRYPPLLPQDETMCKLRAEGEKFLQENNYQNYEVSAFARAEKFCQHNLNYWEYGDYLGIGAGAHSKLTLENHTIIRTVKQKTPLRYLDPNLPLISSQQEIQGAEILTEFMINNLRLTAGFSIEKFTQRTGIKAQELRAKLASLVERDLLQVTAERVRPSSLGRRFLDEILVELV